jgi:cytochrome c oxidase subunit II
MKEATVQLPRQMSTLAAEVDLTYYYIFWLSVFMFVAIIGASVYFLIKYRASQNPYAAPPGHHDVLELFWTFAPIVLLIPMFHYGFKGYVHAMVAPAGSIEVRVKAKQWAWDFYHPGQSEPVPGELVVPIGQPMKMVMSSEDVLHSFFIPEFRVKRDLVPGMYTSVWFEATEITSTVGKDGKLEGAPIDLFCTEYCGLSHSLMLAKVHIVSAQDYKKYIEGLDRAPNIPPAEWGKDLFAKNGCNACHSVDGSALVGPSLKGAFGRMEAIEGGTTVSIDENYIRESILRPQAKIVKGYTNAVMPPFVLKDNKLDAVIAYIKSLK